MDTHEELIKRIFAEQFAGKDESTRVERLFNAWETKSIVTASVGFFNHNEIPEKVLPAVLGHNNEFNHDNLGLLWVSNSRLFYVEKDKGQKVKFYEYSFDQIANVERKPATFFSKDKIIIYVRTASSRGDLNPIYFEIAVPLFSIGVTKEQQSDFVECLAQKIKEPLSNPSSKATENLIDELERLGKLHQQGLLTDDEFSLAKKKLIG